LAFENWKLEIGKFICLNVLGARICHNHDVKAVEILQLKM